MKQSKKFKFNKSDGVKIATGAVIALSGAMLTYIAEILPNIDFNEFTPLAVALISVCINFLRKYLAGKS